MEKNRTLPAAAVGFIVGALLISACSGGNGTEKGTAKEITSFGFLAASNPALPMDVSGVISGTSIAATVPNGTSVTALTPTMAITGVSVTPASGAAQDFTSPVTYTVTAEDGSTKAYTVTVTVAPSSAKEITGFTILGVDGAISGAGIALTLPFGTDVTSLTPSIAITGASVSPASGAAQDFSSPIVYTVTAADGSTQDYTVTVTVAPSSAKDITKFTILNVDGTIGDGTITVALPSGTDLTNVTPTIEITGESVSPASGVAQDFSSPVTYTVTAADGSTKDYTVTVILPPAAPSNVTADAKVLGQGARVTLNWTDNAVNETGFTIEWAKDPDFTIERATGTAPADATTYQSPANLDNGATYYFRIWATNEAGDSAQVNADPFPITTP